MSALVEVAAEEWDDLLVELGLVDVYFRRAYLESASLLGQGSPVFLYLGGMGGGVIFPALVRETREGYADVDTPMGYGGPMATGDDPPVAAFFEAYEEWCAENRVVATFARFHPVLANQCLAEGRWRVERTGHTIGWRVEGRAAEEIFAGLDAHHRRVVRKARRAGVQIAVAGVPEDLDDFVALYRETMRRKNASAFYFFPDGYWLHMGRELADALLRFEAYEAGELAASILCLTSPPVLHYHLGASTKRGLAVGANHVLFYETAAWASAQGFSCFHLGGGVGGYEDSLYQFKRRFDPEGRLPATVAKAVHDEEAYRNLSGIEKIDYSGYFPAYRRPG